MAERLGMEYNGFTHANLVMDIPNTARHCTDCECNKRPSYFVLPNGDIWIVNATGGIALMRKGKGESTFTIKYRAKNYIPWRIAGNEPNQPYCLQCAEVGKEYNLPYTSDGMYIGFQTDHNSCVVFYDGNIVYEGQYDCKGVIGRATWGEDFRVCSMINVSISQRSGIMQKADSSGKLRWRAITQKDDDGNTIVVGVEPLGWNYKRYHDYVKTTNSNSNDTFPCPCTTYTGDNTYQICDYNPPAFKSSWKEYACICENPPQRQEPFCSPVLDLYPDDDIYQENSEFLSHVWVDPATGIPICEYKNPSTGQYENNVCDADTGAVLHLETINVEEQCVTEQTEQIGFHNVNPCAVNKNSTLIITTKDNRYRKIKPFRFVGFVDTPDKLPGIYIVGSELPDELQQIKDIQDADGYPEQYERDVYSELVEGNRYENLWIPDLEDYEFYTEDAHWTDPHNKEGQHPPQKDADGNYPEGVTDEVFITKGLQDYDVFGVGDNVDNSLNYQFEWYFLLGQKWYKGDGNLSDFLTEQSGAIWKVFIAGKRNLLDETINMGNVNNCNEDNDPDGECLPTDYEIDCTKVDGSALTLSVLVTVCCDKWIIINMGRNGVSRYLLWDNELVWTFPASSKASGNTDSNLDDSYTCCQQVLVVKIGGTCYRFNKGEFVDNSCDCYVSCNSYEDCNKYVNFINPCCEEGNPNPPNKTICWCSSNSLRGVIPIQATKQGDGRYRWNGIDVDDIELIANYTCPSDGTYIGYPCAIVLTPDTSICVPCVIGINKYEIMTPQGLVEMDTSPVDVTDTYSLGSSFSCNKTRLISGSIIYDSDGNGCTENSNICGCVNCGSLQPPVKSVFIPFVITCSDKWCQNGASFLGISIAPYQISHPVINNADGIMPNPLGRVSVMNRQYFMVSGMILSFMNDGSCRRTSVMQMYYCDIDGNVTKVGDPTDASWVGICLNQGCPNLGSLSLIPNINGDYMVMVYPTCGENVIIEDRICDNIIRDQELAMYEVIEEVALSNDPTYGTERRAYTSIVNMGEVYAGSSLMTRYKNASRIYIASENIGCAYTGCYPNTPLSQVSLNFTTIVYDCSAGIVTGCRNFYISMVAIPDMDTLTCDSERRLVYLDELGHHSLGIIPDTYVFTGCCGDFAEIGDDTIRKIYYKNSHVMDYDPNVQSVSMSCCNSGTVIRVSNIGNTDIVYYLYSSGILVGTVNNPYFAPTMQCVGDEWVLFTWSIGMWKTSPNIAYRDSDGNGVGSTFAIDPSQSTLELLDGTVCTGVSVEVKQSNPLAEPEYHVTRWKCNVIAEKPDGSTETVEYQFDWNLWDYNHTGAIEPCAVTRQCDDILSVDFNNKMRSLWCKEGSIVSDDNRILSIAPIMQVPEYKYKFLSKITHPLCAAYIVDNPSKLDNRFHNWNTSSGDGLGGSNTNIDRQTKRVLELPTGNRGLWNDLSDPPPATYKEQLEEWQDLYPAIGMYISDGTTFLTEGVAVGNDEHPTEDKYSFYDKYKEEFVYINDYYAPCRFDRVVKGVDKSFVSLPFNPDGMQGSTLYHIPPEIEVGTDCFGISAVGSNGCVYVFSYDSESGTRQVCVYNAYTFDKISCNSITSTPVVSKSPQKPVESEGMKRVKYEYVDRKKVMIDLSDVIVEYAIGHVIDNKLQRPNVELPYARTLGGVGGGCGCGNK